MSSIPMSSTALPKTLRLKNKPKLFSYCIPVTEKIAVSLKKSRSNPEVKANVKALLIKLQATLLLKKALQEVTKGFRDRYSMDKAQDRIAKIVEARYQLKRYKEDVSPEEFSPKAIIERWFSFLV